MGLSELEALRDAIVGAVAPPAERGRLLTALENRDEERFWRLAEEISGDPGVSLHAGDRLDKRAYGPVYYVATSAGTLRKAVALAAEFVPYLLPLESIDPLPDGFAWKTRRPISRDQSDRTHRHHVAFVASVYHRIGRDLVPDMSIRVELYDGGAGAEEWRQRCRDHFGCPIEFSPTCPGFRVIIDQESLDRPLPSADEVLASLLRSSLAPVPEQLSRTEVVRAYERCLEAGDDSRTAVAAHLDISERTLFRRLEELGVTHRELQGVCRRQRTLELIARPTLAIKEVARMAGYHDMTSFARVFRRWTGLAPTAFRSRLAGEG